MKDSQKKKLYQDPNQLIKYFILFVCSMFTFNQVVQCVQKYIHPQAATHSQFILSNTIRYPCVTICRRPAFKIELFQKFGIINQNLAASFAFRYFNFSKYTLTDLMENTTYSYKETFFIFGYGTRAYDYNNPNVNISSLFNIYRGRCFTFHPLKMSEIFTINGGYTFFLSHNITDGKGINEFGISTHGYEIYLHDPNEILTVDEENSGTFLEYIDLEASEDMRVKFEIQEFGRAPTKENECITDPNYSKSKCKEFCINKQVALATNCTTPWLMLPEDLNLPECSSYHAVRDSMRLYLNNMSRIQLLKNCKCPLACNFTIYKTSIINRRHIETYIAPNCVISLYSTNLVFRMTEVLGYDLSQLIADIGGSLGFLLGLSVISFIYICEEIFQYLFRFMFKQKVKKETKCEDSNDCTEKQQGEVSNSETAEDLGSKDFETVYKEYYNKNYSDSNKIANTSISII